MRILVTGTSGHVGGVIASHLISLGWDVVGLDIKPAAIQGLNRHVQADISSTSFLETILTEISPCEGIVHAAAVIEKDTYAPAVSLANCFGTQQMLKLAEQWQCAGFIFLSSVPVIGQPRQHPVTEEHPTDPPTAYHASKLFGEHLVRIVNQRKAIGAILRLTSPVGPQMQDNRIFPVFIRHAMDNKPIQLAGSGSREQNYVDARDIAHAVELCLMKKATGLYNIAGRKSISNIDLAQTCIRVLKSSSKVEFSGKPDTEEGIIWDISFTKASHAFGFHPAYSIEESISNFARACANRT